MSSRSWRKSLIIALILGVLIGIWWFMVTFRIWMDTQISFVPQSLREPGSELSLRGTENEGSPETDKQNKPSQAENDPSCEGITQIPLEECQALLDLYVKTNGTDRTKDDFWFANMTPCGPTDKWFWLSCQFVWWANPYKISMLSLPNNNLNGPLSSSIGNFANLMQLNLPVNKLVWPIPTTVGNLSNLRWLYLWQNQLSWPVPKELGKLANIREINIATNKLIGLMPIPAKTAAQDPIINIENRINLQKLSVNGNSIAGTIPATVWKLINLKLLDLWNNSFFGVLPSEIADLPIIEEMYLRGNAFKSPIPPSMGQAGKLPKLKKLNLGSNWFDGMVPPFLANIPNLQSLQLNANRFCGRIPEAFSQSPTMVILWWNRLHSTPNAYSTAMNQRFTTHLQGWRPVQHPELCPPEY